MVSFRSLSWSSLFILSFLFISATIDAFALPHRDDALNSLLNISTKPSGSPKRCKKSLIRKAWHTLTRKERKKYIDAVKCTQHKKGITKNYFGIKHFTIFEDFAFEHAKQTPYIHTVGHFLHWHRYYVKAFETALREQCGYDGAQPYWDYAHDHPNGLSSSSIWSPIDGFGGNGLSVNLSLPNPNAPAIPALQYQSGGGCISDGPFKNYLIRLPRQNKTIAEPRCIERAWSELYFNHFFSRAKELDMYRAPTFYEFLAVKLDRVQDFSKWKENLDVAMSLHGALHLTVGGTQSDKYFDPVDPIFFMLHTNIDRYWRRWQAANPLVRHNEYALTDVPPPSSLPPKTNQYGFGYLNVTNTGGYKVTLSGLAPEIAIKRLMDTTNDLLCYDYDTTYKPLS
ncbi:Di-copper centre-containing protein [Ascobolus immersus RN42]|uniref:Di-copper centre-containing protein n=1 Tax=Ascobolus immersus RN42 TaxID=1160509 RepID=A0A3N4IM56_ASCIM|nr:Di-copper centre-containing protein [Ascobolus immersus RN42]